MNRVMPYLTLAIAVCFLNAAIAKDPPRSAEELRKEFESAFNNKDKDRLISLFCWDGWINGAKLMYGGTMIQMMMASKTNIAKFTLVPAPTNFQMTVSNILPDWQEVHGYVEKQNIPIIGVIHMNYLGYDSKQASWDAPCGKKDNVFYLSLPRDPGPGMALRLRLDNIPRSLTYTGYWTYVKEGKEISIPFNDIKNPFHEGWGDYVIRCYALSRTSTNENLKYRDFVYPITEGEITNIVYQSGRITNEEPVIHERK
jgi:hypothetical protein